MPLHLDYRPSRLSEVWGNEETVASLQALLDRGEVPHAMMFCGPSGCGKTTLGRIMKSELGCAPSDFYEMDSADFRGIDTIRQIRSQMQFRPSAGPCRVWLLDEVHQLSKDAQSALLKALEDTPKHVYFILCTTDPEKLLKTIRTRCMTFEVESMTEDMLFDLMTSILTNETSAVPEDILRQIATDSLGSPRAALVVLDKIMGLQPDAMKEAAKQRSLEASQTLELCRSLLSKKPWKEISRILKSIDQEPESIRRAVLGYATAVILNGRNDRAFLLLDAFSSNLYDTGKAGLVKACYIVTEG